MQIAEAVNPDAFISILAAVEPVPWQGCAGSPGATSRTFYHSTRVRMHAVLAYLLRLLPAPHHLSILQARCPAAVQHGSLVVPLQPQVRRHGDHLDDESGPDARPVVSFTDQMLAVAAASMPPPPVYHDVSASIQADSARLLPECMTTHRQSEDIPAVQTDVPVSSHWHLTRLTLGLTQHESPKIFLKLARMHTIRTLVLHVSSDDVLNARMPHLMRALRELPAVGCLSISVSGRMMKVGKTLRRAQALADLLQGIRKLEQLTDLSLTACVHPRRLTDAPQAFLDAVRKLSRMQQLTRLEFRHNTADAVSAAIFASALQQLSGLAVLELDNDAVFDGALMARLYEASGPPTLRALMVAERVLIDVHGQSVHAAKGAALATLTALHLKAELCRKGGGPWNDLADVVGSMHNLQSLTCSPCGADELKNVTAALQRLSHLTYLHMHGVDMDGSALCEMLDTEADGRGNGGEGLRYLRVSGVQISSVFEHVSRIAARLGDMPQLQELDIGQIRVAIFDISEVMCVLLKSLERAEQLQTLVMPASSARTRRGTTEQQMLCNLSALKQVTRLVLSYRSEEVWLRESQVDDVKAAIQAAVPWMSVQAVVACPDTEPSTVACDEPYDVAALLGK